MARPWFDRRAMASASETSLVLKSHCGTEHSTTTMTIFHEEITFSKFICLFNKDDERVLGKYNE
jgi:hypothetical protein